MIEHVYAYRNDRLGTALLNLAHAWRFARKVGAPLTCVWPSDHPRRGIMPFRELFEWPQPSGDFLHLDGVRKDIFKAFDLRLIPELQRRRGGFDSNTLPAETRELFYPFSTPLAIGGEGVPFAVEGARGMIRSLRLHPALDAARKHIQSQLKLGEFVSIHMRRGDIVDALLRSDASPAERARSIGTFAARYADSAAYVRSIVATRPQSNVLLFSDEPESVRSIRELLTTSYVRDMSDFDSVIADLTPVQQAFLEMLIMSETDTIHASKSNFSGFAAFYGNTKLVDVRPWIELDSMGQDLRRRFGHVSDSETLVGQVLEQFRSVIDHFRAPAKQ